MSTNGVILKILIVNSTILSYQVVIGIILMS